MCMLLRRLFYMNNKELKSEMISNGLYSQIREINKRLYKEKGISLKAMIYENQYDDEGIDLIDHLGNDIAKECAYEDVAKFIGVEREELISFFELQRARKVQNKRVLNHIEYLFKNDYMLIFATFTFDEKNMRNSADTRYQKVIRSFGPEFVEDYIGNIDYGKNTDREHYHFILAVPKGCFEPKYSLVNYEGHKTLVINNMPTEIVNYDGGFTCFQLINENLKDREKVSKYIAKLTNHSLKVKQTKIKAKRDSKYHKEYKKQYKKL